MQNEPNSEEISYKETYNMSLTLSCTNNVEGCFIAAISVQQFVRNFTIILLFLLRSRQEPCMEILPFLVYMFAIKLLIVDATFTVISSREVLLVSGNTGTKNKSSPLSPTDPVTVFVSPVSVQMIKKNSNRTLSAGIFFYCLYS